MEKVLFIFLIGQLSWSGICFSKQLDKNPCTPDPVSKEYYWLGFSLMTEKEIGGDSRLFKRPLLIVVEEKDSVEMRYLSALSKTKFKRNKLKDDCSNCHLWFTSKNVNKKWKMENYYGFVKTKFDTLNQLQWYKPLFDSELLLGAEECEKLSFIAGVFLRTGRVDSANVLSLTIDESPIKAACIAKLIESLGCTDINVENQSNVVVQEIILKHRTNISFLPSTKVALFIKNEIVIKKEK